MNICLTCNYSPWSKYTGGGPIATHNLANQLSRMGIRVFVVYTVSEVVTPSSDVNYEIIWTKDFGGCQQRWRGLNVFSIAKAVGGLGRETSLDIIHGAADEAALLPFIAKKNDSIFVMTIHRGSYPKLNSARMLWRPDILCWQYSCFFEWYAYRKAARVFAVSNYAKAHVVASLGLNVEKIETVYNGIGTEFFTITRKQNYTDEKIIFNFGRLELAKGTDILLKAFALVLPKLNNNQRVRLVISGEGIHQKGYEQLATSLGISDKVTFTGWANREQLMQLMADAYLGVFTSRFESFGLTVGESMAASVPTISTNSSSIPEIITDGETGLLVPPENPQALAEKILYALHHPEEMERIARAGRERIREKFTWEKVAQKYLLAYESLLARRRTRDE